MQSSEESDSRKGESIRRRRDICIQKDPTTTLTQKERTEEETREKNTTQYRSRNIKNKIREDVGKVDLEILLLNTLKITALKVEVVTDKYLKDKPYISLFCFTEIKVDSIDFIPVGIQLYTKHKKKKEKKGGGLAIGHLIDKKIKLEEIKIESSDILILEGTIVS